MRRPALVLVSLLAVLLTAAALSLFGGDPAPAGAREVGASDPPVAPQVGAPEVAPDVGERRALTDGDAQTGQPADLRDAEPGPSLVARVRVVDGASGEPVPSAKVAVLAEEFNWFGMSGAERHRVQRFGMDRVGLLAHFGRTERADADGLLRLPIARTLLLACEDAGRYGELSLRSAELEPDVEQRLLLHADGELRVRIVDPAKRPLPGLPIGLLPMWNGAGSPEDERALHWMPPLAFTGEDGVATVHHLPRWVERYALRGTAPEQAGVRLLIPDVADSALVFDPLAPPAEVVELIAPPTGAVVVELLDAEGAPVGSYDDLVLRRPDDSAPAFVRWLGEPAGDGAARFPYVTLGQPLLAQTGGSFTVEPQRFVGPAGPGDLVEVVLRVTQTTPVLTGRVVDADLRPLGGVHLRIPFGGENFGGGNYLATTSDADGRFHYEFSAPMIGERITLAFVQQLVRRQNAPLVGEIAQSIEIAAGPTDLGTIVMRALPVLASGQVVVDGAPPAQRPQLAVEAAGDDGAWGPLRSSVVTFGAPGRFEVRGRAGAPRHRLTASARDCLPADPLEFRAGQRDLRLELRRGGSLRVELQLDDPRLAGGLAFELAPERPTPEMTRALTSGGRSANGAFDGGTADALPAFAWRGLEPGDYRLELRAFGRSEPLVDLRGLVVPPGAACEDPRVRPLDLRERLTRITITALDPTGRPGVASGIVWSGNGDDALAAWLLQGKAVLLIAGRVDLNVAARGCSIERVLAVGADQTVRLRPLPTVRLAIPEIAVPAGTTLSLLARPARLPIDDVEARVGDVVRSVGSYAKPGVSRTELGRAGIVDLAVRPGSALELEVWLARDGAREQVRGCAPDRLRLDAARPAPARLDVPRQAVLDALEASSR